jgi:tetratricopeptide (TPR) repeat protein
MVKIRAHHTMGLSLLDRGEFAAALKEYEQLVALYDPKRDRFNATFSTDILAVGFTYLAWALWFLGYYERATSAKAQAFKRAAELNHVFPVGYTVVLKPNSG